MNAPMNNAQAVGAALGVKEIRDNSKANSTAIPVKTENIPDELKPLRWAVWRAVPRADGKVGKPPCNAITGLMIGANKPATWGTFDEAVAAYSTGGWDGIGVLMEAGNGIVGLDFDRIEIIAAKGTPLRTLLKRAQEAGIYLEKSPGGKGARGFVLGELPGNKGRRKGGIELYNDARFLTVTGQGKGKVIDGQGLVDELLTIIGGEAAPAPQSVIAPRKADLALVDSLSAWAVENHPRLWEGHWAAPRHEMESGPEYPSQSEADFALVGHLAREAVKRGITATEVLAVSTLATFERSKLYRPEKCRQIENYAIPKAVQAALVKPVAKANLVTAEPLLSLAAGRLVLPKSPPPKRAWTIDKLLPSGKCGVLAGLGGVSKTMVASVWGVHVAIGKTWADLDVAEGAAMLLLGEEDQAEVYARVGAICRELSDKERTTVEDRLLVFPWAGKDLRLTRLCEGNPIETTLVSEIIRAAQAHAARCGKLIRLIVIDHARLAIGGDPNDAQHVSEVMRASTKIADVTGAAVLLIAHSPKTAIAKLKNGDDADAADVAGSIAWVDNSRSAMVLTTMREDEAKKFGIDKDLRHQYARLKLVKANYAPTDWGCWLHRHTVPGWGVAVPVVATLAPPPKTSSNRDLEVRVLTLVSELPGQLSLRKLRNNYAGKTKHLKASEGEVELALQKLLKENRLQQRAPNEEEKREYGLARTPLVLEAAE